MKNLVLAAAMIAAFTSPAFAQKSTNISPNIIPAKVFELSSADIVTNGTVPAVNISNVNECTGLGQNLSPRLNWQGEPAGTLSYAVTILDQDAPNGGFWNWIVYDIPTSNISLTQGASSNGGLPKPAKQSFNSNGTIGYTGPCPPLGDKLHRYLVVVHALNTTLLDVPENAPATDVLAAINNASIAKASITGFYSRPKL